MTASEQTVTGIGCQTAASSCRDWKLDDVVTFLSETSELKILLFAVPTQARFRG